MTDRPILFSGPMVRALLAGTKTQTRRVLKVQPHEEAGSLMVGPYHPTVIDRHGDDQPGPEIFGVYSSCGEFGLRCPYGQPGDRLWVRETWRLWDGQSHVQGEPLDPDVLDGSLIGLDAQFLKSLPREYRADSGDDGPWRPSIHMPRWAIRITLEITAVRVERLQDISEADAQAEGCIDVDYSTGRTYRAAYRELWEQINGHGSWAANPWVWVVEFRRITP